MSRRRLLLDSNDAFFFLCSESSPVYCRFGFNAPMLAATFGSRSISTEQDHGTNNVNSVWRMNLFAHPMLRLNVAAACPRQMNNDGSYSSHQLESLPRMSMTPEPPFPPKGLSSRPIPMLIFGSRWLQLPLYVGLIVAQGIYVVLFLKELWHLFAHAFDVSEQQIMLAVLGLIDVVMISNLLVMVIVGGYETFVSRLNLQGHPDEPEWLSHVNASVLKIKLAMAIIGISSIHLLRTFIEAGGLSSGKTGYTETGVMWQTIIHTVFILSAIGISYVDRLSNIATEEAKRSVSH
jgi:uncharacterized protein (TIGR00645 family)